MIIDLLCFIVCFGASVIGAICGIGGGVIIKPVLDATGVLSVASISFLSGCTVLSMTAYSVWKSRKCGDSCIEQKTGIPLALGAAFGGLLGKALFSYVSSFFAEQDRIGAVQAACLLLVTLGTLFYTLYKDSIYTLHVQNPLTCIGIGTGLGIMSSFLGIGGGPINLVVLFFFFSMPTKVAAENSLYIIFFSQASNLIYSWLIGTIPDFSPIILLVMIAGGILGGICGRAWNRKLEERMVDRLFIGLMVAIICINVYNIYKFL